MLLPHIITIWEVYEDQVGTIEDSLQFVELEFPGKCTIMDFDYLNNLLSWAGSASLVGVQVMLNSAAY